MTATRDINDLINRMRDTDLSTRRHALAHELRHAVAALSTPATEPQGYVEGVEAVLQHVADGHPKDFTENYIIARAALAARPDPQPAADTRVVTVAQLEAMHKEAEGYPSGMKKLRAMLRDIIGGKSRE